MSSELSGRVTTLEDQMTQVLQDLLDRPTTATVSALLQNINNQDSIFSDLLESLDARVRTLQNLYINLAQTEQSHYLLLSGVSGDFLSFKATITGYTGISGATGVVGPTGALTVFYDRYRLHTGHPPSGLGE